MCNHLVLFNLALPFLTWIELVKVGMGKLDLAWVSSTLFILLGLVTCSPNRQS